MAQRRMFSLKIVDSDAFLDMPLSTQALYFHLSMRGDDDGFVGNPKKIMRLINCNDDDMKVLLSKRFILPFESGICVIKHWKIHNYIQKDRYTSTTYLDEKKQLITKENNSYSLDKTKCIHNVSKMETQVRLGKVSKGKETYNREFEALWEKYPSNDGKKAAYKHYLSACNKGSVYQEVLQAMTNYLKSDKVKNGYIKNGSTFFNNWRDWINYKPAEKKVASRTDL